MDDHTTDRLIEATEAESGYFIPGDKVHVRWMDEIVSATVHQPVPRRNNSRRKFYLLSIPGVKGHPAYEFCEINRE